jgi:hypothetical protein
MKKYTKVIIATLVIILLGFGLWQARTLYSKKIQTEKTAQEISTTLKIDGENPITFNVSDFVGKSVLEATQSKTNTVTSGTGVNAFVTSIEGRTADSAKNEFWKLIINGSDAQVGAGSYFIQKGDSILWQIDTY